MESLSYHNFHRPFGLRDWHPQSHKFDCPSIATAIADKAIREANELREKLRGRRILESIVGECHE